MVEQSSVNYEEHIRAIEDFPEKGIRFYDIAPLLGSGAVFKSLIEEMSSPLRGKVDKIVGLDARGFIFGSAMASELGVGFVMLRKPHKLPGDTYAVSYDLEYGSNELEIQSDMLHAGESVALVDDVIATGGTAVAGIELVQKTGADIVEFCSLLDLPNLGGSDKISAHGVAVRAIISIEGNA